MPIYCDNCGHQNRDSAKFCQGCGGKIIATTANGTLQPGVILNKTYAIKNLIKQGGMGAVYKAFNRKFDTVCAVKELLSQPANPSDQQYMIDSFEREAKILHKLRHPNIPVVVDYFIESGRYYLVMDYIEGKDMETVITSYSGSIVPENTVIEWAKEILDALNYLHSQNPPIIYRDMKPGNIMLRSSDKKIVLIDFGIARTVTPGGQTEKTRIGTSGYAPVEQCRGKAEPRSDLYSLGATIHHLLTGIEPLPFRFEPLKKVNSKISTELENIVMKALKDNLYERFSSAKEMKEAVVKLSIPSQIKAKIQPVIMPSQINQIDSSSKDIYLSPPIQKSFIEPEMVYIKGGAFLMGSDKVIVGGSNKITVSSFYIGKYPVTNKEYFKYDHSYKKLGDNLPVVNVSWDDVLAYCKWLSNKTGKNYRLPTEEEWEYACKAGTTTKYYWGDEMDGDYCWYLYNSGKKLHSIGQKKPNPWGLYDMTGNVWEWCNNRCGVNHFYRGGSWYSDEAHCQSVSCNSDSKNYRDDHLGFRLAITP